MAVDFMVFYRSDFIGLPLSIRRCIRSSVSILPGLRMFSLNVTDLIFIFAYPSRPKWFVIIYGGIEALMPASQQRGNVAHLHLGGMLFVSFIWYWRTQRNKGICSMM